MQEVTGKAFQETEAHRPSQMAVRKEQLMCPCHKFLFSPSWLKSDGQVY